MFRFAWSHKTFVLAAPLVIVLGTLIHELAHAAAVWIQGGVVTDIAILPSWAGSWGHMSYLPDPRVEVWWVSMAPLFAWTGISLAAGLALPVWGRRRGARLLFLVFFVLPVMDVALSFAGLYAGAAGSDFHKALGGLEVELLPAVAAYFAVYAFWGWRLFRSIAPGELGWLDFLAGYAGMMAVTCLL